MAKYAQPDRRPAVVTGASSGIGAATAAALAAAGFPVALGARRAELCEQVADRHPRARAARRSRHSLDVTDASRSTCSWRRATDALGESRCWSPTPASSLLVSSTTPTPSASANEVDVNLLGAHRLVRAVVPGMVERKRGDVLFVSSDVAVRARPFMSAYAAGKWGLEGMAHALQMELEGTGVRASIVRPGRRGARWAPAWDDQDAADVLNHWVRFGLARHPHFLKPQAIADAIVTVVSAPRGVHLNLVEVTPEAPIEEEDRP